MKLEKACKPWWSLAVAGVLMCFVTGCSSHSGSGFAHTGTEYLAADGSIITIGGKTESKKEILKKQKSARHSGSEPDFWWRPDGIQGSPSITIDLTEQRAYFVRGGQVVGMTPISSGREGYGTPSGSFAVTQKSRDHVSNLYGDYVDDSGNVVVANVGVRKDKRPPGTTFRGAPMPYFMRIVGAVGMHAGYLPGYPASHGCIRLPEEMAAHFFENASMGTPVLVKR